MREEGGKGRGRGGVEGLYRYGSFVHGPKGPISFVVGSYMANGKGILFEYIHQIKLIN
jgi:hypothetical protein